MINMGEADTVILDANKASNTKKKEKKRKERKNRGREDGDGGFREVEQNHIAWAKSHCLSLKPDTDIFREKPWESRVRVGPYPDWFIV